MKTSSYIPNWYQSFAMDQRVEQLEKVVENVVRQGDLLRQLTETVNKLSIRVKQIAS